VAVLSDNCHLSRLYLFRSSHSRQSISAVPRRIATKFAHRVGVGSELETFENFSPDPTSKNLAGKPQIFEDSR